MASGQITSPVPVITQSLPLGQLEDLLKLQKAAQKITSILDLDQLIDKVVNEVAQSFGCVEASIYLHDEARGELIVTAACGACAKHGKGYGLKIGKEGLVGHVAATLQTRYAPDVQLDPYYMACGPTTRSEVAIPLLVDGKLVGVFSASHPDLDAFPPAQLRMLQALSSHVAVAIHNARLFQRERQAREKMSLEVSEARVIQQALLPKSSPFTPGFSVSGLSMPAGAVGGDWYDFIPLDRGRWGLVLADVAGKGTAAALLMSATRGMLRSLAEAACTPSEVLTKLNDLLTEDFPAGRFVTMIYAVFDPEKRTLTFANAGHLAPLLIVDGKACSLDTERGLPLGLGKSDFSESTVALPEGSRLMFYSDGITEAENADEEPYGVTRLQKRLAEASATPETILDDVGSFAEAGLSDDATIILIKG
jgi:sigma-B regulation protein RsbU (phosphoserine phosphatase)